jgi:hypothetical protein
MYGLTIVGVWMLVIAGVGWARAKVGSSAKRTSDHS